MRTPAETAAAVGDALNFLGAVSSPEGVRELERLKGSGPTKEAIEAALSTCLDVLRQAQLGEGFDSSRAASYFTSAHQIARTMSLNSEQDIAALATAVRSGLGALGIPMP